MKETSIFFYNGTNTQHMFAYFPRHNQWYINEHLKEPTTVERVHIEHYQRLWQFILEEPHYAPSHEEWNTLCQCPVNDAQIQHWIDTITVHGGDYAWLTSTPSTPSIAETNVLF